MDKYLYGFKDEPKWSFSRHARNTLETGAKFAYYYREDNEVNSKSNWVWKSKNFVFLVWSYGSWSKEKTRQSKCEDRIRIKSELALVSWDTNLFCSSEKEIRVSARHLGLSIILGQNLNGKDSQSILWDIGGSERENRQSLLILPHPGLLALEGI